MEDVVALSKIITVEMPSKRITRKKGANNTVYIYYTVRAYRNANGKPTSDEVAIGKLDDLTGKLIPNKRYYEIFNKEMDNKISNPVTQIKEPGCVYVFDKIAEEINLKSLLQEAFPDDWVDILLCAFYMVCEGNVMMYYEDWCEKIPQAINSSLTSQKISKLFARMSETQRLSFLKKWMAQCLESEYIAYDVSSISTYSENITIAEWGYNRDGDNLAQVNFAMFFGETSRIPVFYNVYNGSIADKSHLIFASKHTKELGMNNVRYVMDRGFVTEDNLRYLNENNIVFITGFPSSRNVYKKWIEHAMPTIKSANNRIQEHEIYGITFPYNLYDCDISVHVYFNPDKCADEQKQLFGRIQNLEKELADLSGKKRITRKYTDYFLVKAGNDIEVVYEKDIAKIDEKLKFAGYFVLISSGKSDTATKVLDIYRNRDLVEKAFNNLKNDLDFRRLKTHYNDTTDGKLFVGFIALIIRVLLQTKLKNNEQTKSLSFAKLLLCLKGIRQIIYDNGASNLMPLTSLQKNVLAALGMSCDDLIRYAVR